MLQQLYNSHTTLTETSDNKRTTFVTMCLEVIKSTTNIVHCQTSTSTSAVFVMQHECLDCGMTIIRCKEAIARRHIRCHLLYLQIAHVLTMNRIIHISIMTYATIISCPIFLPRRYDVEHISSTIGTVSISCNPHFRVAIIRRLRNILSLST